ncbi:MAG: hypothetical protein ACJAZO_003983, partial [Myxococcota bacterium]
MCLSTVVTGTAVLLGVLLGGLTMRSVSKSPPADVASAPSLGLRP